MSKLTGANYRTFMERKAKEDQSGLGNAHGSRAGSRYADRKLRTFILERDRYRCRYCRVKVTDRQANIDHVVAWPWGLTVPLNLVTACMPLASPRHSRPQTHRTAGSSRERVSARVNLRVRHVGRHPPLSGHRLDRAIWAGPSMTLKEAAAQLGLTPDTLRQAIARGSLKARKLGRDWIVEPKEVERYRTEHRRAAASVAMKATT